ncbi:hypothetical protein [Sandaracinus amylolyticus]|uniref:hypothetical protein n=1 Tax=Sandaracinus amylolyticus TaxID=927083 RepID=UPI001F3AB99F|nr:hypothetical protein [Sandaracinus amylolyticus]UJR86144.1 Hypothetical protein I5071_82260 [Sandaracinus amylolyticus]
MHEVIERARRALRSADRDDAAVDVPALLRELAGAHLTLAFAAGDELTARLQGFHAADVLEVATSLAHPDGHGTELFLDDAYDTSVLPRALGPGARATYATWLDALHAAMWVGRIENFEALASDLRWITSPPSDLGVYARIALGLVRGEPYSQLAHTLPDEGFERTEHARWIGAALRVWEAIFDGDRDAIREGLVAMIELEPSALVEGVSLGASAMLVHARRAGLEIAPFDARLRVPPF